MMKRILYLTLAVLAVATVANAQPDREDGPPRWQRLMERLDLTETQQQAVRAIHERTQEANQTLRKELVRLENKLEGALLADAPDEAAVLKLVEEIGEVRVKMQLNRVKAQLAVRKELTPEQRDQLILLESRHPRGPRGPRAPHGQERPAPPAPRCGGRG
jgi:Spy/CpxP family protein refolding chaperone